MISFTGRLASMKRAEAFAIVRDRGGAPRHGIARGATLLIVGELGWPLLDDGKPSRSLTEAKLRGVPIVSERRFLEWIGKSFPDDHAKSYTPIQLAALSRLPADIVERLTLLGLIDARDGLYGFRDLAAARQISRLLACGTPLSVIIHSLYEIRKWLPDARLWNVRLFPESSGRLMVEQPEGRADKRGQFVLPVGSPADDPEAVFEQAQAAEEAGDPALAESLYRRVIKLDPADPAAAFNLGNLLRGQKRQVEAEAAYRAAVKADKHFTPAWYNLGDLLDDLGRHEEAVQCLKRAVAADPQSADAFFNLALILQRLEQYAEAARFWRRYLELDGGSSWASRARRAMKYCEIRIAGSGSET